MTDQKSEITSLTEGQLDQVTGGCKGIAPIVYTYDESDIKTGSKEGNVAASLEMGINQC